MHIFFHSAPVLGIICMHHPTLAAKIDKKIRCDGIMWGDVFRFSG